MHRGPLTVVFDAMPELMRDREGNVIGIDAMVRAFRAGSELRIDPHRRFYNPPLMHDGAVDPLGAYRAMLFDSIEETPHPAGWRTKGTVDVFFSSTADGYINSGDTTYANARAGTGSVLSASTGGSTALLGQLLAAGSYSCREAFVSFDTSSIDDAATITAAVLSIYWDDDFTDDGDFTIEARAHDWGATLTTADFVAGASLSSKTLLASLGTASWATGYNNLTSESAFVSAVNKTGTTYVLLASSDQRLNTAPTGQHYVSLQMAETSGTSQDPKLTVTYSPAVEGTGSPSLPRLTASAGAAHMDATATGTPSLPHLTMTAGIAFIDAVGGSAVATLPRLTASAAASMKPEGTGAATLPRLAAAGAAVMLPVADGSGMALPRLTAQGYAVRVPAAIVGVRGTARRA